MSENNTVINGFITMDYELGMGMYTGSPEKCLIEPMDFLISMVGKYGVKMNVFVDAADLLQLTKLRDQYPILQHDYDIVTKHIKKMDAEGHAIQLHLHPQWLYSKYNGDRWGLDFDHYKLSDMPLNEQKKLIQDGTILLNSLITRKVSTFRAGGYSIENFHDLYDTFLSLGIVNETSVLRGGRMSGKYQTYNYRHIPKKTSYRIGNNIKCEDLSGFMKEYPIATMNLPYIVHFFKKYIYRKKINGNPSKTKWGDGVGIGLSNGCLDGLVRNVLKFFTFVPIRASIDECYSFDSVYNYSVKQYHGNDFVIMGHPKLISPYSVTIFENFIKNHPNISFKLFPSKQ